MDVVHIRVYAGHYNKHKGARKTLLRAISPEILSWSSDQPEVVAQWNDISPEFVSVLSFLIIYSRQLL